MTVEGSGPRLEVVVDRRRINRIWGLVVALESLGLVIVLALLVAAAVLVAADTSGGLGLLALLPPLIALGYIVWIVTYTVRIWRRQHRPGPALVVDESGMTLRTLRHDLPAGWEAIAGIDIGARGRLHIGFVPPDDPRSAGFDLAGLTPRERRQIRRHGLLYSLRILRLDAWVLAQAVRDCSRGQVVVTGPVPVRPQPIDG